MKAKFGIVIALVTLFALVLAACGGAAPAVAEPVVMEGTQWKLVSYLNAQNQTVELLPGTEITTLVNNGEVSGTGSCNRYTGTYTLVGDKVTVKVVGTTQMYCAPEELMAQEKIFLGNLNAAASVKVVGNKMELSGKEGHVLLTYNTLEPVALVGTTWAVTSYNNGRGGMNSPVAGSEITAVFGQDGSLTGSGGCNNYNATYTVDGVKLTIGPAASTKMACDPKSVMDQETAYFAALETVIGYQIQGDELRLLNNQGVSAAVFGAKPADTE